MSQDVDVQAKAIFDTVCKTLDKDDWYYQKNEEKLRISCTAHGEDLSMDLEIIVRKEMEFVILISKMPFTVKDENIRDVALAVTVINNNLVDGAFDYNIATGNILFRITEGYRDSILSESAFTYMLYCSCFTIDKYNDKLMMLATGIMNIEQFLDAVSTGDE